MLAAASVAGARDVGVTKLKKPARGFQRCGRRGSRWLPRRARDLPGGAAPDHEARRRRPHHGPHAAGRDALEPSLRDVPRRRDRAEPAAGRPEGQRRVRRRGRRGRERRSWRSCNGSRGDVIKSPEGRGRDAVAEPSAALQLALRERERRAGRGRRGGQLPEGAARVRHRSTRRASSSARSTSTCRRASAAASRRNGRCLSDVARLGRARTATSTPESADVDAIVGGTAGPLARTTAYAEPDFPYFTPPDLRLVPGDVIRWTCRYRNATEKPAHVRRHGRGRCASPSASS